jgi:hypothetical protein
MGLTPKPILVTLKFGTCSPSYFNTNTTEIVTYCSIMEQLERRGVSSGLVV